VVSLLFAQLLLQCKDLVVQLTDFFFHVLHPVPEGTVVAVHAALDMCLLVELVFKASVLRLNHSESLLGLLDDLLQLGILVARHHPANISLVILVKAKVLEHSIELSIVFD